jgi:hypothetical protein
MLLLDLHLQLAASIGDPVSYNPSGITREDKLTGAVRYSSFLRDSYLKRAMTKIHQDALIAVSRKDREEQARRMSMWFPTSTKLIFGQLIMRDVTPFFVVPDLLYPYALSLKFKYFAPFLRGLLAGPVVNRGHYVGGINVPILDSRDLYWRATKHTAMSNEPLAQILGYNETFKDADGNSIKGTFVHFVSNYFTSELTALIADSANGEYPVGYELTYLPQTPNLTTIDLEDDVKFENMYEGHIIRYATYYALLDSEDVTHREVAALLSENIFNHFEYPEQQ